MSRMSREELILEVAELDILLRLDRKVEWIMAEIDNLNTAVANLSAATDQVLAKIDALKNQTPTGVDPAAVQTAADAVQAQTDRLTAAAQ